MGGSSSKDCEDQTPTGSTNSKSRSKNTKSKKLLLEALDDHEGAINCMALSDDGSLLVTGGEDCMARMWSTKTDVVERLGVFEGHIGYITCVAIAETYVITGSADNTVRKWAITTCECVFVFKGHTCRICRLICTGDFIFSSSYDKTAIVWLFDAEELGEENRAKALVRVLKGHTKGVYPLLFIPAEGIPTEVEVEENQMDINPGDVLITGSADCTARSWCVATGGCLKVFEGHTMPIMCLSADNTGKTLFTAGGDSTLRSWDVRSGAMLKEFSGHGSAIIGLQMVNKMLYTISCDQTARSWVAEFGDCTRVYKGHNHSVTCLKYYEGIVFTGCGDGIARAFDAKSGSLLVEIKGHEDTITALAVVDTKLYTTCVDGNLRVFDVSHLVDDVKLPCRPTAKDQLEKNNRDLKELEEKLDCYIKEERRESVISLGQQLPGAIGERAAGAKKAVTEQMQKIENHAQKLENHAHKLENHAKQLESAVSNIAP